MARSTDCLSKWRLLSLVAVVAACARAAVLDPIATSSPSTTSFPRATHPVLPQRFATSIYSSGVASRAIPTNKFWANIYMGTGTQSVITHPYQLQLSNASPYGLKVCHTDSPTLGEASTHGPVRYYLNPFINNVQFGATQFTAAPTVEIRDYDDLFGVTVRLTGAGGYIEFPLVRGMAYVTATYSGLTPLLPSQHAILSVNGVQSGSVTGSKFKLVLNNGQTWLLYSSASLTLNLAQTQLTASSTFSGTLRFAQLPSTAGAEKTLDDHSTVYPTGATLDAGVVDTSKGWYRFSWTVAGSGAGTVKPLMYALPHQTPIIDRNLVTVTSLQIRTTTKGMMTGIIGDSWVLRETGLTSITWMPPTALPSSKASTVETKMQDDITGFDYAQLTTDSFYWAGKYLQKLATLCLMTESFGSTYKSTCTTKLKEALNKFISRSTDSKLIYDHTFRGVVRKQTSATTDVIETDSGVDYGNSFYNDHHFHFGYFVFSAAVLRKLDSTWAAQYQSGSDITNAQWIETLIRDVANPSDQDEHFPRFRSFDWYMGHSWANGVFEMADGKDEESSSEEVNFHYAMLLWGLVSNNQNLRELGNLMFAIARRSVNEYILMMSSNTAHPADFVKNHVSGILFEQKVDHTNWFSTLDYCTHGIQMLPVLPITELVRYPTFVEEEWPSMTGGDLGWQSDKWGSLLYTNYAIINSESAYNTLLNFAYWDEGLSRSWALFFAATRPPASSVQSPTNPDPYTSWSQYVVVSASCTSPPPDPTGGSFDSNCLNVANGGTCALTCNSGYTVSGGSAVCSSGSWTSVPTCVADPVPVTSCASVVIASQTDYYTPGADLASVAGASIEDCRVACAAQSGCAAMTLSAGFCYLKNSSAISEMLYCADCESARCSETPLAPIEVVIQTFHKWYLQEDSTKLAGLSVSAGSAIPLAAQWQLEPKVNGSAFSLKSLNNNQYLVGHDTYLVSVDSATADAHETFDLVKVVNGATVTDVWDGTLPVTCAIRTWTGRYLAAQDDGYMVADRTVASDWEFYTISAANIVAPAARQPKLMHHSQNVRAQGAAELTSSPQHGVNRVYIAAGVAAATVALALAAVVARRCLRRRAVSCDSCAATGIKDNSVVVQMAEPVCLTA